MFSTLLTVALFIAPAIQGAFADFAINSPKLVQCQSSKISWEPTKGPYSLMVVNASDPCGDALVDIGNFDKTFTDWKVTLPAGSKIQLSIVDADDDEGWSKTITVGDSDDTSCLSTSTGSGSGSSASPSSTPAGNSNVTPIGAANAGTNPLSSGAITARQASTPLLTIAGLAAAFALSL
jgi:hypothetical protein